MKSFFSIVYLPLRPDLQEKISIGLVMSNSEKNIFKFSDAKLHIIKNLFSSNRYNLVKDYFNNLKNEIEPKNDFPDVKSWETFFLAKFHNNIEESEPCAEFECRALFRSVFHLWRQLPLGMLSW